MSVKGAIVLIINKNDEVLLLRRTPGDYWAAGLWAYPGGRPEEGETPQQAAIRETKEETNLDVSELQEVKINLDRPVSIFYTRSYSGDVKIDFEHTDWGWISRGIIENYALAPHALELFDWVLKNGRK